MDGEKFAKEVGMPAAIGTTLGVASSFGNGAMPHPHNPIAHLSAHGGRVATDAFRHSLRHGSTVLGAAGAGAVAVGSATVGGVSAAAVATGAAVVAAAPFVVGAAVIGAIGYGIFKIFED